MGGDGNKMAGNTEKGVSVSVTLSATAHRELSALAEWKGEALALLLRQVLEAHHENPGTQKIISKAIEELKAKRRKD
jgi:hypothetical protein